MCIMHMMPGPSSDGEFNSCRESYGLLAETQLTSIIVRNSGLPQSGVGGGLGEYNVLHPISELG
jgi:hypothetical protein